MHLSLPLPAHEGGVVLVVPGEVPENQIELRVSQGRLSLVHRDPLGAWEATLDGEDAIAAFLQSADALEEDHNTPFTLNGEDKYFSAGATTVRGQTWVALKWQCTSGGASAVISLELWQLLVNATRTAQHKPIKRPALQVVRNEPA